ncbi:DgyrCDS3127 [Dimorphilus gyrociliatus]|uniref:DgyrCDS3127 n=1 Tax=Dimorphilus gyrociliatus TaxID=2664684 RepID=A0A7I8VHB5_9ANNE|nr:DgyrCDS3127 [Dimorphilus gyrociliatus]
MACCGKKRRGRSCFNRKKVQYFDIDKIVECHLKNDVNFGTSTDGNDLKINEIYLDDNFTLSSDISYEEDKNMSSWLQKYAKNSLQKHETTSMAKLPNKQNFNELFSTTFTNTSGQNDQEFHIEYKKSVKCARKYTVTKAYKLQLHGDLKITPDLGGGLNGEWNLSKSKEDSVENSYDCSVNSNITVPPKTTTKVSILLDQRIFKGKWRMKTTFKGNLIVCLRDKDTNKDGGKLTIPVKNIFTRERGFALDKDNNPTFLSEGACEMNLAMDKKVIVEETPINELQCQI